MWPATLASIVTLLATGTAQFCHGKGKTLVSFAVAAVIFRSLLAQPDRSAIRRLEALHLDQYA